MENGMGGEVPIMIPVNQNKWEKQVWMELFGKVVKIQSMNKCYR